MVLNNWMSYQRAGVLQVKRPVDVCIVDLRQLCKGGLGGSAQSSGMALCIRKRQISLNFKERAMGNTEWERGLDRVEDSEARQLGWAKLQGCH